MALLASPLLWRLSLALKSGTVVKTDTDSNLSSATDHLRKPRKSPVPFKLQFPPVMITVLTFRVIVSPSELVFVSI